MAKARHIHWKMSQHNLRERGKVLAWKTVIHGDGYEITRLHTDGVEIVDRNFYAMVRCAPIGNGHPSLSDAIFAAARHACTVKKFRPDTRITWDAQLGVRERHFCCEAVARIYIEEEIKPLGLSWVLTCAWPVEHLWYVKSAAKYADINPQEVA